jgi:hypothetical protein
VSLFFGFLTVFNGGLLYAVSLPSNYIYYCVMMKQMPCSSSNLQTQYEGIEKYETTVCDNLEETGK